MWNNRKIKSFTLSEMMVVTVITGIVVALAFSVLTLVRKQMQGMAHHYGSTAQWQLLEQSLRIDFHRYRQISYHPEEETLRLKHEFDSVSYVFHADKIIKDRDTFFVPVKTKAYYYKGEIITEGLLDAVQLQSEVAEQQHKKLFIFKQNDATNTINSWHFN